jgi:transcription factor E
MQKKLLFDLVEDLAGEGNGRIVEILYDKKDVNEFLVSKKMELTVNQVRNILYKLSNHGLVSFIRKKDKRKGWYIYYWTLNTEKSLVLIENYLERKIKKFGEKLHKRENDRYYTCPSCGIEVKEHIALEQDFVCDECAELFQLSDNSPYIRDLKSKITRNRKLLEQIQEELILVRIKKKAKRDRANKKLEKEKEALKEAKRLASKKLRDEKKALEKKNNPVKKIVKKPATKKKASIKKKVVKKSASKKPVAKKKVVKKQVAKKKVSTKKVPVKKKAIKKPVTKKPTKKKK